MRSSTGIKRFAGLLAGGVLALLSASALGDSAVTSGSKAATLDACVGPTSDMRRNHMDYLKHGRDRTVHEGVRGLTYSLSGCVDCHAAKGADGGYQPVNAEGQFCAACHEYTAVRLACFQCHSKTPGDSTGRQASATPGPAGVTALEPHVALTPEAYAQLDSATPEE